MQVIDGFAEHHKLPLGMHRRIHSYFDYVQSNHASDPTADAMLVEHLSPQLRMDLRLLLYADFVSKVRSDAASACFLRACFTQKSFLIYRHAC